jgi:subtilisin family serine protease
MSSPSALFSRSLAACLLLGFSAVLSGADTRVYVAFKSSDKGHVQAAVAASGGKVHHEFDDLGAMAASIPEQAIAGLSHNPHVAYLEIDPPRFLYNLPGSTAQSTPYGIGMVNAPTALTAIGSVAPIKVGVIDSGVFKSHVDLQGVSIDGYASTGQSWDVDLDSHGTHVTGTITGVNNTVGVVGVAPGVVSIYMVKVFGDTGEWVYSSDLLSAARKAQAAGSRIISMSLGGSLSSRTEKTGFADLYTNKNTLLVAAAGNDGNNRNSYPASYDSVISVAAIDSTKTVASFSQYNSQVELAAPGVAVLSTTSYFENVSATAGGSSYSGNTIEFAARSAGISGALVDGGLATATNASWAGKVVLVARGTNSFFEKVMNVQNSGGIAAIIYNNVEGDLFATLGDGNSSTIPAIGLSQADGQALLASVGVSTTVVSTISTSTSGYSAWDGTSMATPHVSGVAALIWAKYSTATAQQVRQALDETAEDLGAAGRDVYYGYGLVNAQAALARLAVLAPGGGGSGGGSDTTAPTISAVTATVTNSKNGSFQITWTTNEPATSIVTFEGGGTYTDTALVTSHKMTFRGTKGATYQYTVTSADAAGNSATSPVYSFVNQ